MTKSAISQQVKRLEDILRVALIDRSGARAKLTGLPRSLFANIPRPIDGLRPVLYRHDGV